MPAGQEVPTTWFPTTIPIHHASRILVGILVYYSARRNEYRKGEEVTNLVAMRPALSIVN
jgi:hypothetical protein